MPVLKAKLTRATLSRASKQRLPQSAPGPQFEREQEWKGKRLQNPSQRWSTIAWMQPPQDRNYPPRGTRMVAIASLLFRRTQTLRQAGDPHLCKKEGSHHTQPCPQRPDRPNHDFPLPGPRCPGTQSPQRPLDSPTPRVRPSLTRTTAPFRSQLGSIAPSPQPTHPPTFRTPAWAPAGGPPVPLTESEGSRGNRWRGPPTSGFSCGSAWEEAPDYSSDSEREAAGVKLCVAASQRSAAHASSRGAFWEM